MSRLAEGKTNREMAELWNAQVGYEATTTNAVKQARHRDALSSVRVRHMKVLPWTVAPEHAMHPLARGLRLYSRKMGGEELLKYDQGRLDSFLRQMGDDKVVAYERSTVEGFFVMDRRPSDGDSMIRLDWQESTEEPPVSRIFIKTEVTLTGATMSRYLKAELKVELVGDPLLRATIAAVDVDPRVSNSGTPVLTVVGSYEVERSWLDLLQDIDLGRYPEGFTGDNQWLFDFYPDGLQVLCEAAIATQRRACKRVLDLIRWRYNVQSWSPPHLRESTTPPLWSVDEAVWQRLRMPWILSGSLGDQLALSDGVQDTLLALEGANERTPLGREVWRIAAAKHDYRVTVIMAVSAVEIELKSFIADVVPQAEWLVMNLPAPPIVTLIQKYLPSLPGVEASTLPPKWVVRGIERAVKLRNTFVHVGRDSSGLGEPRHLGEVNELDNILTATSDMLWLLDVYRGHAWAVSYLSEQTSEALGRTEGAAE